MNSTSLFKRYLLLPCCLFLCLTTATHAGLFDSPPPTADDPFSNQGDYVLSGGGYTLHTYLTQKGTRSQGSHGRLFFNGKEVVGESGDIRTTPFGTLYYAGTFEARSNLWDDTGWQRRPPKNEDNAEGTTSSHGTRQRLKLDPRGDNTPQD